MKEKQDKIKSNKKRVKRKQDKIKGSKKHIKRKQDKIKGSRKHMKRKNPKNKKYSSWSPVDLQPTQCKGSRAYS